MKLGNLFSFMNIGIIAFGSILATMIINYVSIELEKIKEEVNEIVNEVPEVEQVEEPVEEAPAEETGEISEQEERSLIRDTQNLEEKSVNVNVLNREERKMSKNEFFEGYKNKLKDRLFGSVLCEREKNGEWEKALDTIIIEIMRIFIGCAMT